MSRERVQKLLARAGLGSRRACEDYLREGRVTLNGQIARLGATADPQVDDIRVDGAALPKGGPPVYLLLHKPVGVVSSARSQGGRPTVIDLIETDERVYPVGRLDVDSEGLVLLTNDGDLALRLTHPRYGHEKEYRVLVEPRPDAEQLEAWRKGPVMADGGRARPAVVRIEKRTGAGAWLRVIMSEGKKRQIREIATRLGLNVRRLIRVRIGDVTLGPLKPGEWRAMTRAEVERLRATAKAPSAKSGGKSRRRSNRATPAPRGDALTRRAQRRQRDEDGQ